MMEKETKKCPHCGGEILAVAKKCKHCKQWVEEKPEEEPQQELEPQDEIDDYIDYELIIKVICGLAVIVFLGYYFASKSSKAPEIDDSTYEVDTVVVDDSYNDYQTTEAPSEDVEKTEEPVDEFYNEADDTDEPDYTPRGMEGFTGNYTLRGKINGKYAVTMNLNFSHGSVEGTYYYDSHKQVMRIYGDLANLGSMNLMECTGDRVTGEYIGVFDGRVFSGDFLNYDRKDYLPFVLVVQ